METAYIKEVGWKMERMSLSELHGLRAYKTFMHVGVFFLFNYFIINIQPCDIDFSWIILKRQVSELTMKWQYLIKWI